MTRQQQRELKQQKKEALVQARAEKKELKRVNKSFDKMIAMAISKNAFLGWEETKSLYDYYMPDLDY